LRQSNRRIKFFHHQSADTFSRSVLEKIMGIEARTTQRDKQITALQLASVGGHPRKTDIPVVKDGIKGDSHAVRHPRQRKRLHHDLVSSWESRRAMRRCRARRACFTSLKGKVCVAKI